MPEPNSGCHLWIGSPRGAFGYGGAWDGKRNVSAHRLSYSVFRGPIPPGLFVLHTCDTPACVNPDHLYLGTIAQNNDDMVRRKRQNQCRKTHCIHGHPFAGDNLRIDWYKGRQSRSCRECLRAKAKRHTPRLRALRRREAIDAARSTPERSDPTSEQAEPLEGV